MSQQELFPDLAPAAAPVVAEQNTAFDGDIRWLFETATGLDLDGYVDGAFFRVGFQGTEADRDAKMVQCEAFILAEFAKNAAFATEISRPDVFPHARIDAEVKRFLKQ